MKLTICNETFHVEVQYAKRKKIKLEATPEGHLTLKVPRHTSEEDIVAFLESKSEFLMNLRQKQKVYFESKILCGRGVISLPWSGTPSFSIA